MSGDRVIFMLDEDQVRVEVKRGRFNNEGASAFFASSSITGSIFCGAVVDEVSLSLEPGQCSVYLDQTVQVNDHF